MNAGSVSVLTGAARHYAASGPIRGGQPTSLLFQGPAGEAVWVAWWTTPAHVYLPALSGPLLIGGPPILASIGTMPPLGALSAFVLVPEPPAGLAGLTFFSQAGFIGELARPNCSGGSTCGGQFRRIQPSSQNPIEVLN